MLVSLVAASAAAAEPSSIPDSFPVVGYRGGAYEIRPGDEGSRIRVGAAGQNAQGIADYVYSAPTPVIPAADESDPEPTPTPTPTATPTPSPEPDDSPPPAGDARAVGGRRVVVGLTASAPVRARIEVRRAGRTIAGATRAVSGTTTIGLRLTRAAARRLRRRGRLTVVVIADGATRTTRQVLRR